jgi:membrane-associated phospholipid phosphatase
VLYTVAAFPGVSRLFLNEHWSSDVALGAVIGVLAGQRAVGYSHMHPDNRLDRRFLRAGIMRSNGRMSIVLLPSTS